MNTERYDWNKSGMNSSEGGSYVSYDDYAALKELLRAAEELSKFRLEKMNFYFSEKQRLQRIIDEAYKQPPIYQYGNTDDPKLWSDCSEQTYLVIREECRRTLYARPVPSAAPASWGSLTDDQVLEIAPMQGNYSQDEVDAFCGGFRRCAQALSSSPEAGK